MATYGLTPQGFYARTTADIIADVNTSCLSAISPTLNLSAASAIGQFIGIFAAQQAELWDLGQAIDSAFDSDQSTGDSLASLSLLTGTIRRAATYSVAKAATVNLNPGTYAAGALTAYVQGNPAAVFANANAVTNAGGAAANFSVDMVAQSAGPVLAPAGTLTVIASPTAGFNSVTNPTDAIAGLVTETDTELRARRILELEAGGAATADAVRSDILSNLGQANGGDVISATVLANDTDVTNPVTGLPPHSIEAIILGAVMDAAADTALAQQILASKAAGDTAYGFSGPVVVLDSQGSQHSIRFTRPTQLQIYVSLTATTDPTLFPTDGAAQITAAIVAWAQANQLVGKNVIIERLKAIAFTVPGVIDVPACTIGTSPSPVGTTNIPITIRQQAIISSNHVTVAVT